ncbi:MAG: motility protein A [Oscillospiraceae bacterium]
MDIFVIVGFLVSNLLVLFGVVFNNETMGIEFGNVTQFVNYPSLAITVGGTFATLMISFPIKNFAKIIKHFKILFFPPKYNLKKNIEEILDYAKEARMKGLLSLEDKLNQSNDEFLKIGLMLVVDSVEPEKVSYILEQELQSLDERHEQDRSFYDKGAAFAPAFGMIGTLVGLVLMLQNMDDPSSIGPAMGTALLTTLYGSMLANMFFAPVSSKLKVTHDDEYLYKTISKVGIEAIQAGENPKFIGKKLNQMLSSKDREDMDAPAAEASGEKS